MSRNIQIFPWYKFIQSLIFWQATWFLYFESRLSAPEAILLYVVYDLATTVCEVPSGYMSDRLGRKRTLLAAALSYVSATILLVFGDGFTLFAIANVLLGAGWAFASGTDSALLFESLKAEGHEKDIEYHKLKAWRFSFVALALSALSGGIFALWDEIIRYVTTACAAIGTFGITCLFKETPHLTTPPHRESLHALANSLSHPTLLWLLGLALAMYAFGHIPFVLGQPFIREALEARGFAAQTPLISGGVTFSMMLVSVLTALVALKLRTRLGLARTLLLAFGIQLALTAALAISNSLFVIALLLFRMVPDSLSDPFIRARIQPLLSNDIRATYLSVQSLAGRVLFALMLSFTATQTESGAQLPYTEMQVIFGAYTLLGLLLFAALALSARHAQLDM
ncbi:MFS transporter [Shimia sp. R9_2]|uniref:MFS transporter n=1 Tax=Shimia sp. R9_2 TaxID=2821112 RepID=UPI001AD99640|nr:MFS transporter [Shimia sp. R9_2]MBO9398049.1 MFS transporter [Shimia sp. R9_2]